MQPTCKSYVHTQVSNQLYVAFRLKTGHIQVTVQELMLWQAFILHLAMSAGGSTVVVSTVDAAFGPPIPRPLSSYQSSQVLSQHR